MVTIVGFFWFRSHDEFAGRLPVDGTSDTNISGAVDCGQNVHSHMQEVYRMITLHICGT